MPEPIWDSAAEIQSLAHARALISQMPPTTILLRTPERGLAVFGSNYWLAVMTALSKEFDMHDIQLIVDAAESPGLAQNAIADGHRYVRFTGNAEVKIKLRDIAAAGQVLLL